MTETILGSLVFTGLVMALTFIVLGARRLLVLKGTTQLTINGDQKIDASLGEKLLDALTRGGIHLPTSCGGAGTCGLCRIQVSGGDDVSVVERAALSKIDAETGYRLACQVVVRNALTIKLPTELLTAETWTCSVHKIRTVSPLIKEIILDLPEGQVKSIRAGSYVQIVAPQFELSFADIEVAPEHAETWERMGLRALTVNNKAPVARAYSLANSSSETSHLTLNIRLALPPANQPDVPPGIVSSYLFGLRAGDQVEVSGPFGNFFASDTTREMVMIGGGVGMAPLRAIVVDQLERQGDDRTISFWYGARGLIDLYYDEEMENLAQKFENFSWNIALSDPAPEDEWSGDTGFIHDVVYRRHLENHPDPTACEYYLCGPPLMIEAVRSLLNTLGVAESSVFYDDFGG
ncbi:MAG: NADH:ubiquinone reductase (Na(+)-transporting) subunit F [Rhodospirillaceae bacterium]|jgi:Na+-transporting NADH:ubiquinone oxidoreductase subunit F|nr:NADH:ubiquinone reductase (Na(+)-transporting) subunit F [Rhodospirillaceae bacterium]MBT5243390.1 NADH:ubiquinone reductase (Na(+)-transporting) subunit F [Rhodospirillaceae bacterium]MBT5561295.1 NADH:ubiquinone reductase (Na(+)-transporting) subunit F [Rhodospirillaceae bacterium]MBT6243370.1 NADH:ubiquinone reductase (Na(+)-transporting) subunit F [Rhodospirillaceae bacterium]MBT7139010.1 NADH:ubiquinone reductase (Na(+)-transporting) subunit F [Rhodospirillaceae bacterium]